MEMKRADGHTEMNILLRSSFIHFHKYDCVDTEWSLIIPVN